MAYEADEKGFHVMQACMGRTHEVTEFGTAEAALDFADKLRKREGDVSVVWVEDALGFRVTEGR